MGKKEMKIKLEIGMSIKELKKAYKKNVPKSIRCKKGLAAYARNILWEELLDVCREWDTGVDGVHCLEGKIKYKGKYKVNKK